MGATLAAFQGRHDGESIVVCGCGPSLTELAEPQRFTTIGVNDVGRLFDPNYLVVVNPRSQFKGDRFRYVETSKAQALFTQLDLGPVGPPVVRFKLGRYGGTDTLGTGVLNHTQNSPYVAVCLAAHMRATRIGLIGVDLTDHHFFAATGRHPLAGRLREIDAEYGRLAAALRSRGIELVNLGPTSRLTSLPKVPLEDFAAAAAGEPAAPQRLQPTESAKPRRVFIVNYRFIACGDVFANGLANAAQTIGVEHTAAWWDDPALAAKLRAFRPDLVFVVHGRRFAPLWQRLKRELPNVKSAVWLTEEPYEVDDTARWSRGFDAVFLNDPSTLDRHANAHSLPACFDPVIYRDPGTERPHFTGFIGAANPTRERFLLPLAEAGLLGYVVGGPWKSPVLQRLCRAANVPAGQAAELYQRTSMVLNVFRDRHHFNARGVPAQAMNPRIYEALACGALVVSEPRPELCEVFPELPTFSSPEALVQTVSALAADRGRLRCLLEASRARLGGHDYASRLRKVMDIAMHTTPNASMQPDARARTVPTLDAATRRPVELAGWRVIGSGCTTGSDATTCVEPRAGEESGLASLQLMGSVCLRATIRLSEGCRFIAKVRHAACGEPAANSYHLVSTSSTRSYFARHHQVLKAVAVPRGRWFRLEMYAEGPKLRLCIDGREAAGCTDDTLAEGFAFIGACSGLLEVKELSVEPVEPVEIHTMPEGWIVQGTGVQATSSTSLVLAANADGGAGLASRATFNDVELEFDLRLGAQADFIAKLHHQLVDDPDANSYHLVASATQGLLARHDHVIGRVSLARSRWQRVRLRWVDQQLSVSVDGRIVLRASDNLLQSGHCVLAVSTGSAEIGNLAVRDLTTAALDDRVHVAAAAQRATLAAEHLPFVSTPRRHLMYHVWPVRDSAWRWNVERLLADIDLFNGRRIIGIVHDRQSEAPAAVRAAFEGHGCEFVEMPNDPIGECITFPVMLGRVASLDPDDVTFYGHAKGVRHGNVMSQAVRRWTEALYDASLGQWPLVAEHLQRYALTGSFRMLGRFRAHQYLGDWHYSGTFFWLRHALAFRRPILTVPQFYGGVEVWPGLHFRREETGCLLLDQLRQLAYNDAFWRSTGDAAVARMNATRQGVAPPPDLRDPAPFEGHVAPRLEQIPQEFEWFLDRLVAAAPRSILTIGSMHGGVEWHVARRFRERGLDIRITAVDLGGRAELSQSLDDARSRWTQSIELVVGDSTAETTRARIAPHYDAVFIDGDHGYRGARRDYEFALTRQPRLIALHDIVDSMWHAQARCCVSRLWSEIEAGGQSEAVRLGQWGGIGITSSAK